jgi:DNA-directed RNA polymerase specialized sigma24 family protein
MTNHYHLVIETPDGNLSKGMRQLNGVYTQRSNRRHGRVGHLFQGRYKAVLADADSYLLELARYVVLNPVRAGMVQNPDDWPWSSYSAMIGKATPDKWLTTEGILAQFSTDHLAAVKRYVEFVAAGLGRESIWKSLSRQVFLGDDKFVERMQSKYEGLSEVIGVPKAQQRAPAPSLDKMASEYEHRDQGILAAYATGEYSYQQIAEHYGLHFTTVGKIVRNARRDT